MSSTDSNTSNLTAYDWKVYNIKREQMFKGTIIVCIIYAALAFIFIALSYFLNNVRDLLFVKFLPFTVIYIVGTILIVVSLLIYIMSYQATKVQFDSTYPEVSCPDYWDMEVLDEKSDNLFDDKLNNGLFKYKCVLNPNIFNKKDIINIRGTEYDYRISDALNITDARDRSSDRSLRTDNNINDSQHIYKDIKSLNLNNNSNMYSNLIKTALTMNNYSDIGSEFRNLYLNTSGNSTIPPFAWKYNNNLSDNNKTQIKRNPDKFFYGSIIRNWNGLTHELLETTYGINTTIGVYLFNVNSTGSKSKSLLAGYIKLIDPEDGKKRLMYKSVSLTSQQLESANINTFINQTVLDKVIDASSTVAEIAPLSTATAQNTGCGADSLLNNYDRSDLRYNITSPIVELIPTYGMKADNTIDLAVVGHSNYIPHAITKQEAYDKNNNKTIPLICDTVYPLYMAYVDNKYNGSNDANNTYRCKYANLCGVPWSDMQCDAANVGELNEI